MIKHQTHERTAAGALTPNFVGIGYYNGSTAAAISTGRGEVVLRLDELKAHRDALSDVIARIEASDGAEHTDGACDGWGA